MQKLIHNVRFHVILFSAILGLSFYLWVLITVPEEQQVFKVTQSFGFLAATYLYLALLITPLYTVFPSLPYKGKAVFARRAIGVSSFFFALIHAANAFFLQLGGFEGFGFLSFEYKRAVLQGGTALLILALMTATSLDAAICFMGQKKWKFLHRFVYVAAFLVVVHALALGSHLQDVHSWIRTTFLTLVSLMLVLQALRVYKNLRP